MPTVNATPKSASANSFVTVAEADLYHDARLHNAEWSAAATADKEQAVIWATQTLQTNFAWYGVKRDRDQALQWPRFGVYDESGYSIDEDTIPQQLKDATSLMAYLLILTDRTLLDGADAQDGIKKIGLGQGDVSIEFDPSTKQIEVPVTIANMLTELGMRKKGSATTGTVKSGVAQLGRR